MTFSPDAVVSGVCGIKNAVTTPPTITTAEAGVARRLYLSAISGPPRSGHVVSIYGEAVRGGCLRTASSCSCPRVRQCDAPSRCAPWHDRTMSAPVQKSEEQWREELSPEEYAVLRQAATERPWTGPLLDEKRVGVYRCRACGAELFRSDTKFDSHCGWPSFYDPTGSDAVTLSEDRTFGMVRTEGRCANCNSHLGHLFDDAPQTPTGDRYCMNSVALTFEPAERAARPSPPPYGKGGSRRGSSWSPRCGGSKRRTRHSTAWSRFVRTKRSRRQTAIRARARWPACRCW